VAVGAQDQGRPGRRWVWRLQRLAKEDPSFRVHTDQESGQTIISGMGELHLEIIVDRMKREIQSGMPTSASHRWPIGRRYARPSNPRASSCASPAGRGQYGHVWLKIEPQATGKGATSSSTAIVGGRGSTRVSFRPWTRVFKRRFQTGVIAGYPIVDVKVTIFDGSYHDVDSNENGLQDRRARWDSKEGFRKAKTGAPRNPS